MKLIKTFLLHLLSLETKAVLAVLRVRVIKRCLPVESVVITALTLAVAEMPIKDLNYWCENLSSDARKSRAEIERLLRNGADVNQRNRSGRTPLMLLCWVYQEGDIASLIRLFLDHQANVHFTDNFGWNALHFICRFFHATGLEPAIQLLVEQGIDIGAETKNGNCALQLLCQFNNGDQLQTAVLMLLCRNQYSDCKLGKALHLLCRYNHQCKNFETIFHLLIHQGADVGVKASNRRSLLHSICRYTVNLNMSNLVERVVTAFKKTSKTSPAAFVDCQDIFGNTATLYAAQAGCMKTVKFLMQFGRLDAFDGFNKNAASYLMDIVRFRSFTLCTCCRDQEIDLHSILNIFNETGSKEKVTHNFQPIALEKLAKTIPDSMDRGFTNNPKPSHLYIPDPEAWERLLNHWRSPSPLDLSLATDFLDSYSHKQHEEDADCSWCSTSRRVENYVQLLMNKAAEIDQRFEGKQFHYGSSAERTKILSPDEFDFMLVLSHFTEQREQLYHNSYGITSDCPSDEFRDKEGNISSARLLHYYYQLLLNAVHRVESFHLIYQDINYGETCVTLHLLYRDKKPLLKLTVDITVAIARHSSDSNTIDVGWRNVPCREHLVPFRNLTGTETCRWKLSFSSMERDIFHSVDQSIVRCCSLLKLLVLLSQFDDGRTSRKTRPSSYALKTCLLEYLRNSHPPWKDAVLGEHVLGICRIFLNKKESLRCFFDPAMPVYEIGEKCREVILAVHSRLFTSFNLLKPANSIRSLPTLADVHLETTPNTPTDAPTRPLPSEPQLYCCSILLDKCSIM